jgi:hypothetical protein
VSVRRRRRRRRRSCTRSNTARTQITPHSRVAARTCAGPSRSASSGGTLQGDWRRCRPRYDAYCRRVVCLKTGRLRWGAPEVGGVGGLSQQQQQQQQQQAVRVNASERVRQCDREWERGGVGDAISERVSEWARLLLASTRGCLSCERFTRPRPPSEHRTPEATFPHSLRLLSSQPPSYLACDHLPPLSCLHSGSNRLRFQPTQSPRR